MNMKKNNNTRIDDAYMPNKVVLVFWMRESSVSLPAYNLENQDPETEYIGF